jgi:hypothetical protein
MIINQHNRDSVMRQRQRNGYYSGLNPSGVRLAVSCRKLILTHLPTFCWQTAQQVLTMLEQIDEDISEGLVIVNLSRMVIAEEILEQQRFAPFKRQVMSDGYVNVYRKASVLI